MDQIEIQEQAIDDWTKLALSAIERNGPEAIVTYWTAWQQGYLSRDDSLLGCIRCLSIQLRTVQAEKLLQEQKTPSGWAWLNAPTG